MVQTKGFAPVSGFTGAGPGHDDGVQRRRGSILALVLAGGEGGRLGALTRERAKPALPFGGVYRLIDFPLSNCHHSRISDVWVLQQYEAHSLSEYLSNGRPWDLDRTFGGLRVVQPYLGDQESGWYEGNADAIQSNREAIERLDPELVLTLSADAVYRLDYAAVIDSHLEADAELTMVTTRVAPEEARRFGVVERAGDGRATAFAYKPEEPTSDLVTTEVFVYGARVLLDTLGELAGSEGARDFGDGLLPALVDRGRAWTFDLDGYWRDVGTVDSYWQTHMDLLGPDPLLRLDDRAWPVLTRPTLQPPARITASAAVDDSLLAAGAEVAGTVERSILGFGASVAKGATVRDGVLLPNARVAAGATVERAVVDEDFCVETEVRGSGGEIAVAAADDRCRRLPRSAADRATVS
jgi:glucose-1-phosphate adenylyltransferase